MKRYRKIVNANVKHTKGLRIHRHCYMRVPPPPIPRMSHPRLLFNMLGEKNFKKSGANQRILKAKLVAIYLDCHKQR